MATGPQKKVHSGSDVASREQVLDALEGMSDSDFIRLHEFAGFRTGSMSGYRGAEDAVAEAVTATLLGRRKWRLSIPILHHLLGCIRSYTSHWSKCSETSENPDHCPGSSGHPLDNAIATELLERIEQDCTGDTEVLEILEHLLAGRQRKEIVKKLRIRPQNYDSAVKKLRRRVRSILRETNYE